MNATLVDNINNKVGENDILIHLGDWSFGGFDKIVEFRERIKCKNIHLVLGNHDHHIEGNKQVFTHYKDSDTCEITKGDFHENWYSEVKFGEYWSNEVYLKDFFSSVQHYAELDVRRYPNKATVEKFRFMCMHYPIASWKDMNQGVIHLHGHVHLPPHLRVADGRAMDVGVDGNGLEPISLDEILSIMKGREVKKLALPKDHHEKRI
jgi:calcineurin-like phosphoesterase family protein